MNTVRCLATFVVPFVLSWSTVALAQQPAAVAAESPLARSALDHVLLWSKDIDRVTAILAVKLGFQVRTGGDFPDGVANRLVWFYNDTYLELLYFTKAAAQLDGDALAAYRYAARGPGANSFALTVLDPEKARAHLESAGYPLKLPEPTLFTPEGPGREPPQEPLWTTVGFQRSPLRGSEIFFIRYSDPPPTPEQRANSRVFRTHPNGGQRISSVWLLVEDAEAERRALERLGIGERVTSVRMPHIGAHGFAVEFRGDRILVLQPDGSGQALEAFAERGAQLLGVSIETDALDRAKRLVERGYGTKIEPYTGWGGTAFLAPSRKDLGLIIEFHAATRP